MLPFKRTDSASGENCAYSTPIAVAQRGMRPLVVAALLGWAAALRVEPRVLPAGRAATVTVHGAAAPTLDPGGAL